MNSRLFYFVKKEFIQLWRDPKMLWVAIFAPIIQLLLFGYVASTDIKHVSTVVFDQNRTSYSRDYIQSFKNSGYFDLNYVVDNEKDMADLIDAGHAKLGLRINSDFSKKIVSGQTAKVQAILDGENSSSATIIQGYISQINFQNAQKLLDQRLAKFGLSKKDIDLLNLQPRVWYNPELKSVYFMVPAIFALVLMIETMLLTSFSIVKEKERGTMEQLIVTPLKPYELILGKLLPFIIVAFLAMVLVFLIATLWFGVPMNGSVLLLFALGLVFMSSSLGLGVFISTTSKTQAQAMMSAIFYMMPSIIITGFIFPIANMPKAIQAITYLMPVRYFLVIVRGIFMKGIGLEYLWPQAAALFIFGVVILALSVLRFKKKMD